MKRTLILILALVALLAAQRIAFNPVTGLPDMVGGSTSAPASLLANPTDCAANQFANAIDAEADLTCAQPAFSDLSGAATDAQVPDNITVTLAATASALAANPTDCSAGQFANAIAANGNLTCAAPNPNFVPVTSKVTGDSPYTALVTDNVILCDTTGGSITINLPALASAVVSGTGLVLHVKKVHASNTCTIDGDGAETIDGAATLAITTNNESFSIVAATGGWRVF